MTTDSATVLVVRIWRGQGGFRASVRRPGDDEPHWFTAPTPLAAYLASLAEEADATDLPARGSVPDAPP